MTSTWNWYDNHASDVIGRYESVSSSDVHGWLEPLLPGGAGTILDVGAGSGRDSAWLAEKGFDVVAVEPGVRAGAGGEACCLAVGPP